MNDYARRRMRDMARGRSGRGRDRERMGRRDREYRDGEYSGNLEYRGGMEYDGRRGVKGTGRYGIGGSRYSGDRRMNERDYGEEWDDDYNYDDMYDDGCYDYEDYARGRNGRYRRDGHDIPMRLSKKDLQEWKRNLENSDGSLGEHFTLEQVTNMAEKLGIRYNGFDEKELCMTANMLYSDLGKENKSEIPPEKELRFYVKDAKAWLEDDDYDGDGSEKLAAYYYCIVKHDEE